LHFFDDNIQKIIFYSRSRRTSDSGLENAAKTVVLFPGSGKAQPPKIIHPATTNNNPPSAVMIFIQ
jgi:hypothetical protein